MKKAVNIITAMLLAVSLWGCGPSRITVAERPAPPVEVRPATPYTNYVWIDGDWVVSGGAYHWRSGYWAPPRVGHAWVAGSWAQRPGGWYWVSGRWN